MSLFRICMIVLTLFVPLFATSPLQQKFYSNDKSIWILDKTTITNWRSDSRSARIVRLSDSLETDSIFDQSANSDGIFLVAQSGAYLIDMSSGAVEHLSYSGKFDALCKVANDQDYAWVISSDSLFRFDKLSREWLSFALPSDIRAGQPFAAYSDAINLYCSFSNHIGVFSQTNETWSKRSGKKEILTSNSVFFPLKNSLNFVENNTCVRYILNAQSFDVTQLPGIIKDVIPLDTALFFLTTAGVFQFDTRVSLLKVLDIPETRDASCFTKKGDTIIISSPLSFVKYCLSTKISDNMVYPSNVPENTLPTSITALGSDLIASYNGYVVSLNGTTGTWDKSVLGTKSTNRKTLTWDDDNGLKLRLGKSSASILRGSVQQNFLLDMKDSTYVKADSITNTSDTLHDTTVNMGNLMPAIDLTLRTTFANNRFLDARYNNLNSFRPAERWLYYRGAREDILASVKAGSATSNAVSFQSAPSVLFEGINVDLESKSFLSTRDRKIIRSQSGAGLITATSHTEVLRYSESGLYTCTGLSRDKTGNILLVPGSLSLVIDGESIDSSLYFFSPLTGDIQFTRRDLLDPSSIIVAHYKVQTAPDTIRNKFEILPKNHFGDIEYSSVAYSPTEWISGRAGVFTFLPSGYSSDTTGRKTIYTISAPLEFRNETPDFFMSAEPEFAFEQSGKKRAGGINLQSRFFKKAGLSLKTLFADTGFTTTDKLTKGYGSIKQQINGLLSYAPLPEIPLSYSQYNGNYQYGTEDRYAITAGVHFAGIPNFETSISRSSIKGDLSLIAKRDSVVLDSTNLPIDTIVNESDSIIAISRQKEKLKLRLYETSSPVIEKLFHLTRFSYEAAWTGFLTYKETDTLLDTLGKSSGQILYFQSAISPIQSVTLSGIMTRRINPAGSLYKKQYDPSVELATFNAPNGVDFSAKYALNVGEKYSVDSTASLTQRSLLFTLRPGAWWNPLNLISLRLGLDQQIICNFDSTGSTIFDQILGEKYEEVTLFQPYGYTDNTGAYHEDTAYPVVLLGHTWSKISTPSFGFDVTPIGGLTFKHDLKWTIVDTAQWDSIAPPPPGNPFFTLGYRNYHQYNFWGDLFTGHRKFKFRSFNDIKWLFGSQQMAQLRIEYDNYVPPVPDSGKAVSSRYLRGFIRLESPLTTWAKAAINFNSGHTTLLTRIYRTDTIPGIYKITNILSASKGPSTTIDLSFSNVGIIKRLVTSHSFGLLWTTTNGRAKEDPTINYGFALNATFSPNIQVQSKQVFGFTGTRIASYTGNILLGLIF